ncbi:MAG: hypothetical protein A2654_01375 [Candidatus Nealsonbacteria bacterium RIFCSPHIGHO2_01_FULL_43_31]|uniref:Pilus assembly protein PilO n=2 Tax=Candidatus Nealsoniibacteriota TaxID=1817911 RepID=A0A1G2E8K7_9BACT|nr:MAG: hypothetical protein UV98_C0008G0026 [Parcubacteria group bacterium GW2011_GWB1_43_6]OGZ19579.1 MAG: hypothetical protein A2654_01375 [Candidatus Nealsonbacteria bacterium RIFCSPHIGHO2_01_FULL_43_31]OGZ21641.1 MAG: hypothetical protein A3D46_01275 [Candidatus Nealsonbacteria bacterium RIFCSPHIGHO2_02_FULL_43_13]OGZ24385.1 MAG: hypothetical protein A2922_01765 [Candidatus Nealsonbacteria bacterium RIFCSPLOWO2_01_FULL_43_36]
MIQNKNIPLIILGIVVMLLAVGVVRPLFLSIKQNSNIFAGQREVLAELEKKRENIKKFQSTYGTYQVNFKKIDQLFIDQEEPVDFIKFLEKEAGRSKLAIDLAPLSLKAGEEDVWPSIGFQVALIGSFPNFLQFLDKIELNSYLISLSDFSLNKPTKITNGDIEIAFQLKVYTR